MCLEKKKIDLQKKRVFQRTDVTSFLQKLRGEVNFLSLIHEGKYEH